MKEQVIMIQLSAGGHYGRRGRMKKRKEKMEIKRRQEEEKEGDGSVKTGEGKAV